jgi:hypothetical protein
MKASGNWFDADAARRIQIIVTRDLAAWLPRRQPSVNFSPLDVLACAAFSRHFYSTPTLPIYFGNRTLVFAPGFRGARHPQES